MPISYIEKGLGLHIAINGSGHNLRQVDNVWICSDDTAVQAIIDSYDPLPYEREQAKKRITNQINVAAESLESAYPEIEKRMFPYQRKEAEAYQSDSGAATPVLDAIATKRGVARTDQINRVLAKISEYDAFTASLIGERQRLEDLIDSEADFKVIQSINYESS